MKNFKTLSDSIEVRENGSLPAFSYVGGYRLFYVNDWRDCFCADCANKNLEPTDDFSQSVHWEGPPLTCDGCGAEIESSYGDPEGES